MRDLARDFQAMPLVAWMVWVVMAIIAAPVMALTPDTQPEAAGAEGITLVASPAAETGPASGAGEIEPGAIGLVELLAGIEPETAEEIEPETRGQVDLAEAHIPSTAGPDGAMEDDPTEPLGLAQANSGDLADPSDPFFFDENSVEPLDDGVLAPLSGSEPLPDGTTGEVAELEDGPLTPPSLKLQTAAIQEGDDFSARARVYGHYFLQPNVAVVGAVDLSTGDAFSDTDSTGLNISELYVIASPPELPGLRGAAGLIELSSFFDRNSFAKDSLTHFINPVFQTNPALATTQLESQPAALVHWRPIDEIILKTAVFSSDGFDDLDFDAIAAELGVNLGNLIVRGTYVSATDNGDRDGIPESFQINRNGVFGPQEGDREVSYGVNAEWFIPELNAGLFGRYGHHRNADLDISGDTYSFGVNFLDLFIDDDRFGIGYGRQLSDDGRRQGDRPDVLETFYDIRLAPNARAAISWQLRDEFSESVLGLRIRADWDLLELFD